MSKNNFVIFEKSIYSKTVSNNSFESLRRKRRYCCKIRCSSRTCAACPVVLDINVERRLVSVKNDYTRKLFGSGPELFVVSRKHCTIRYNIFVRFAPVRLQKQKKKIIFLVQRSRSRRL